MFSTEESRSLLDECGFRCPVSELRVKEKASIRAVLIEYHYFLKPKACIDQFIEGLDLLNVTKLIRTYPDLVNSYFVYSPSSLTAGTCTFMV